MEPIDIDKFVMLLRLAWLKRPHKSFAQLVYDAKLAAKNEEHGLYYIGDKIFETGLLNILKEDSTHGNDDQGT